MGKQGKWAMQTAGTAESFQVSLRSPRSTDQTQNKLFSSSEDQAVGVCDGTEGRTESSGLTTNDLLGFTAHNSPRITVRNR